MRLTCTRTPDLMHRMHESKVDQVGHMSCCHGIPIGRPGMDCCTQQLPDQAWPLLFCLRKSITQLWLALQRVNVTSLKCGDWFGQLLPIKVNSGHITEGTAAYCLALHTVAHLDCTLS